MKKNFRWGIFGTGAVSAKFVAGLSAAQGMSAVFVASRSQDRADDFASSMGIPYAIEGYAKAAKFGNVDAIYIATPPSEHCEHALLCIESGIPVLIEKPLATSREDVIRIIEAAARFSTFAMEAMWTRFIPAAQLLKAEIAGGTVGEVRMISGSFGTSKTPDLGSGSFDPKRGGGSLSHLGVYPLSLAQWMFGAPSQLHALGRIGDTGVDEDVAFQLQYQDRITASFYCSIRSWSSNDFQVMGTEGLASFHGSIVRPHGLRISRQKPLLNVSTSASWRTRLREHSLTHKLAQLTGLSSRKGRRTVNCSYSGNGYHYQAEEVRACVYRGDLESKTMPLSDSLSVISTVDTIRRKISEKERGVSQ
ncbi:Gfo/Idh/MocA family protein [Luteimonas terrae]|uniref:Gfo/Idh/MocA family oxidoreductase n=1 Tax=Luteimonas terrae TaxID=1530191 RepID=A0A4R5U943_9GAMM|nr:Gfo/Idh/MocA family oxidoreductase [Luteimonas terrae]TDK30893.1 Gfo/Idh/MocA family oxidoreductase [Luteimonas terrae]